MYKARSRSFQRGLQKRGKKMPKKKFYEQTKNTLTERELAHFGFGSTDNTSFLDRLEPVIRHHAKNGFRKPGDVARLLNKAGIATACGERWTPRLAWFLLESLFGGTRKQPPADHKNAQDKATPKHERDRDRRVASTDTSASSGPLTRDEIAERLAALGRVVVRHE